MRPPKNPPPLTLDNLLAELKPGRGYSIEVIALKFGASTDAARAVIIGAMLLGKIRESKARRGFRVIYWIPDSEPPSVARSRCLSPYWKSDLTGYTDYLLGHMNGCISSRGKTS